VSGVSTLDRKKRAFRKYFGENFQLEDMFGKNPFLQTFEELESVAARYREWYISTNDHSFDNVPDELRLPYRIHFNMSGENIHRATLFSELTGKPMKDALDIISKARSIPIPVEYLNGATIYASTIYRGKAQVSTGTVFENRVANFVNSIADDIEMVPGHSHGSYKYDKDILIGEKYKLSAEISFQVTTNSVIERKSHLEIPNDLTVIMIFGGLGWIERINALERIASSESGYANCFGPSEEEMERLKKYLFTFREK
jgi:hypothetical protein